jgi:hypothetical protein
MVMMRRLVRSLFWRKVLLLEPHATSRDLISRGDRERLLVVFVAPKLREMLVEAAGDVGVDDMAGEGPSEPDMCASCHGGRATPLTYIPTFLLNLLT